jgi:hypothetical protein
MSNNERQVFQSIFDKSTAAIIAQGEPSRAVTGACSYRCTKNGKSLKCAIGQLLTDEQMSKYQVRESFNPYVFQINLIAELAPGVDVDHAKAFLAELQQCHDRAEHLDRFLGSFKNLANSLANRYDLSPIA